MGVRYLDSSGSYAVAVYEHEQASFFRLVAKCDFIPLHRNFSLNFLALLLCKYYSTLFACRRAMKFLTLDFLRPDFRASAAGSRDKRSR